MRSNVSGSLTRLPFRSKYANPDPVRLRVMPGVSSDTYRNPADLADKTGSDAASGTLTFIRFVIRFIDGTHVLPILVVPRNEGSTFVVRALRGAAQACEPGAGEG